MRHIDTILNGTLSTSQSIPGIYRTNDGEAYFMFEIVETPQGFLEMDIIKTPPYGLRSMDPHTIHLSSSARGGLKICMRQGMEPHTRERAVILLSTWSELTWTYIKTGVTIDQQLEGMSNQRQTQPRPVAPPSLLRTILRTLNIP